MPRKSNCSKVRSKPSNCWFNADCKRLQREYRKAKRNVRACKNLDNTEWLLRSARNYRKVVKKAKYSFYETKRRELKAALKNPKEYWKILNFKSNKAPPLVSLNQLTNHFKNLNAYQPSHLNEYEQGIFLEESANDYSLNDPITKEEVLKAVSCLGNGKAPGCDNILNEVVKFSISHFTSFYVKLFNNILDTGSFPSAWSSGLIVPIYKGSGDKGDACNYRGITLSSCLGKVFTRVLSSRIDNFVSINETLLINQAGFRKHQSTSDHVFVLKCLIDVYAYHKKPL